VKQAMVLLWVYPPLGRGIAPPPWVWVGGLDHNVANTFAVVAINRLGGRRVVIQRAAGTVEVLGLGQAVQEDVDQSRVFDLRGEAELGLVVTHLPPAVALPIGVLPLPIASVVLGLHLRLTVASSGRHRPLDHRFVDHRNRDGEVGIGVVLVRDIRATVLLHNLGVARHADEDCPRIGIGGIELTLRLIGSRVEAGRVDVVTEGVVANDAVDTQLEAGEAGVEVGVRIPVAIVALGLEVKRTTNTGIGDHDVEKLHASRLGDVQTEGIVFVLKLDERIVQHVEGQVGDLHQIGRSHLHLDGAEVVASGVIFGVLRDEPRLIVEETTVGSILGGETDPLVSSLTNVVGAEELFVDVLGDAGVALLELEDFLSREETVEQGLDANPVGVHLFAEKLESVAFGAGALDKLAIGRAGVRGTIGVVDLVERGAGIVEPTAKAESLLLGGVVQRPRLLLETGEIRRVGDELLHVEVVEILTALTEKTIQLFARIEDDVCHMIYSV